MKLSRLLGLCGVTAALATLPACGVEATPMISGSAAFYASSVPVDIEAYPHVWYGDRYVYLVGDQWFAPWGQRWVTLRTEPPALYRYRTTYVPPPFVGRAVRPPPPLRRPPPPARGWSPRTPPPPRFGFPGR